VTTIKLEIKMMSYDQEKNSERSLSRLNA